MRHLKTAKIILVLYWGLGYNRSHIRSMTQYSTKMIFAVLDVSLTMGLNIGEIDKVFFCINICCFCRKTLPYLASYLIARRRCDQNNLIQYGRLRHIEFTFGLHFDTFSRLGRQNASAYQILCKLVNISRCYDVSYIFKMASVLHHEFSKKSNLG